MHSTAAGNRDVSAGRLGPTKPARSPFYNEGRMDPRLGETAYLPLSGETLPPYFLGTILPITVI